MVTALCAQVQTLRPTAEADDTNSHDSCTGTFVANQAVPNFYDAGGVATSTAVNVNGVVGTPKFAQRVFSSFAALNPAIQTLNSLVLSITSSCANDTDPSAGNCGLQYSTNNGSTWTTVLGFSSGTWAQTTTTLTLPNSTNIAQLQVRACYASTSFAGGGTLTTLTGYDIALTATPQVADPHRGTVTAQ